MSEKHLDQQLFDHISKDINNNSETILVNLAVNMVKEKLDREYILCSAIHFDNKIEKETFTHSPINITSGFVLCGRRHHNVFAQLPALKFTIEDMKRYDVIQGFLTSEDRFVDRTEGGQIAFKSGQTKELVETLMSEDLW